MPSLIKKNPERINPVRYVNLFNFIRIRTPESRVSKKRKKIISKKELKKFASDRIYLNPGIKLKKELDLSFKINPRLPNISEALSIQPITRLSLNPFGLKGTFAIDEVDHPPIPISQLPPVYPVSQGSRG
jgi:hypothetical protein